ncbi:hypothetical protein ILYODFUR_006225 [Ilyodon furcidens]|uniref:Interferon/interleukin receptor domain-containing protein n=1 Tax=Ilyodon furcidens TaxID=33524 RepID=A0ABV0VBL3_9TELE
MMNRTRRKDVDLAEVCLNYFQELEKREKSFYLNNLEKDVEYCVQVDIKTRVNKNTLPSGWNCTFTSIPEPKTGMLVLVIVTALLIFLLIVLTMGIFCLYYTGFLCKLKEMPTALMFALWPDYVLTPNNMVLNQVTIISQPVKSRNCATMSHPSNGASNSEDEDGEEEDAANLYMDRNAELSSGRGSHQDSANASVNLGEDVRRDSGSFTKKQPAVLEEQQVESGHCEAEAMQVSFIHDGNQSGPQVRVMVQEEEMKTGTQDVSGDVNLFSVTFASMATCDEGEIEEEDDSENSSTDFLRIYTLKPLSQMDSQCEQDDPVSAPLMHPSEENFTESGYEGKCADSWMDYEEEEELSGYLTHK